MLFLSLSELLFSEGCRIRLLKLSDISFHLDHAAALTYITEKVRRRFVKISSSTHENI